MATQVQFRGGTTSEHSSFTGAAREVTVDTTKDTVVIHDGSTAGGFPLAREDASNLKFPDGAVGTPAITFSSDTNTGIYRGGTDILKFVTAGTDAITIDASQGVTLAGKLDVSSGTIKLDGNYPVGSNNVALGNDALSSGSLTGANNVAIGQSALQANTSGAQNIAIGRLVLDANTTGENNTAIGHGSLTTNISGGNNVAIGRDSLANNTASNNTAVGYQALLANTTGSSNVAVGASSLLSETGGTATVAVGKGTLQAQNVNSTAYNTAVGHEAGNDITTGVQNTLIGAIAGDALDDADFNVAVGFASLSSDTKGSRSTALGYNTLASQNFTSATDSANTAVGYSAGLSITTGTRNVLIGAEAGDLFDEGFYNVAVGYQALSADVKGSGSVAIGYKSLSNQQFSSATNSYNTAVGYAAGQLMTTGTKNTIIGSYSGNQGGLDIRASSNNIVISDGDGNPRVIVNSGGSMVVGSTDHSPYVGTEGFIVALNDATRYGAIFGADSTAHRDAILFVNPNGTVGAIQTNGSATTFATSSDYRLKENVSYNFDATTRLKQLKPCRFNFIADGTDKVVDGFIAHEVSDIVPEAIGGEKDEVHVWKEGENLPEGVSIGDNKVDANGNDIIKPQTIDQSKLVPLLVKTIQELEARITALENA